jgi:hypothetical protein
MDVHFLFFLVFSISLVAININQKDVARPSPEK